jgi:phosphoribosylformimino-5-aminoimidazole carboxamide ribotide isomerase
VDLDAAVGGQAGANRDAIAEVVNAVTVSVQVAGGLRTVEEVAEVFAIGAMRATVGTVAIEDRTGLRKLIDTFAERIIVAVDARDGRVAVRGWTETTDIAATDFALQMEAVGVRRLMCTDIATDGTLTGPGIPTIRAVCETVRVPVIAAGGVSRIEDIRALKELEPLGLEGAIVGRALYTGDIKLDEAIQEAEGAG